MYVEDMGPGGNGREAGFAILVGVRFDASEEGLGTRGVIQGNELHLESIVTSCTFT